MSRFERLHALSEAEYANTNLHAGSFLSSTLAQANISINRVDDAYDELPKEGYRFVRFGLLGDIYVTVLSNDDNHLLICTKLNPTAQSI